MSRAQRKKENIRNMLTSFVNIKGIIHYVFIPQKKKKSPNHSTLSCEILWQIFGWTN
jgi:hypothetical protein